MHHEYAKVVVCGLSTGTAIVRTLAQRGIQVTGLDRVDGVASTLRNQKWKHSGLLYPRKDLAQKLWEAYARMHPLERRYLLNVGGHFLVRTAEELARYEALWRDWGIPFGRLAPGVLPAHAGLGTPAHAGDFLTLDSIIDFPALIPDLWAQSGRLGAHMVTGVTAKRLVRNGDAVTGVVYEKDGKETLLHCQHCVVALGGWAPRTPAGHWRAAARASLEVPYLDRRYRASPAHHRVTRRRWRNAGPVCRAHLDCRYQAGPRRGQRRSHASSGSGGGVTSGSC